MSGSLSRLHTLSYSPVLRRCKRLYPKRLQVLSTEQEALKEVAVGIDLGTTNSAVATFKRRKAVSIPLTSGSKTLPSCVTYLPGGEVLIGEAARRRAGVDPLNTFHSVKRFIGQQFADLPQGAVQQVTYRVEADEEGGVILECQHVEEGRLYPEEVSAQVLTSLLEQAEAFLQASISKAVISVPAYFDEEQRFATITAGKIAGLDTIKLIREPVAAALAYGLNLKQDQTVLVLDLGGGTFDVSILEVGQGTIEVLATGGDMHLGGDDFDNVIVDWLIKEHLKPAGVTWRQAGVLSKLRALAEAAKVRLSEKSAVALNLPLQGKAGQPIQAVLTQQEFERLVADLFRRARLPLDAACWQAGVDLGTVRADQQAAKKRQGKGRRQNSPPAQLRPKRRAPISQVLLVGGGTRMPAFRRFVHHMTGLEPASFVQPDEAVALGAAVQAGILEGQASDVMVLDVWQANLMRALAQQRLQQDFDDAAASMLSDDEDFSDEEEGWKTDDEDAQAKS